MSSPRPSDPMHPGRRDRQLMRRLNTSDAVAIGLGSMIGAGIFVAFAPAAGAAGAGLLIGLAIAAVVAFANATSSAQLAAQFPTSGGTYIYGRELLGPWAGFLAGWGFVIGKSASCAAMALAFAAYLAPPGWTKPVAVAAVLVLTAVNYAGITRTAALTKALLAVVLPVLLLVVLAAASSEQTDLARLTDGLDQVGWYGVLQSAGLLFFAFAGYARIATLAEEVRDPTRTIPRAVVTALTITLVLYLLLAVVTLSTLGPQQLANSSTPLAEAAAAGGWAWTTPLVRTGAAAAALGALLALIAGVGRTSLAMARHGDLPRPLAAVHPRFHVPHRAELTLAVIVCALIVVTDLRGAIGISSFGVLLYYLIANLAAHRQELEHRRYPRRLALLGAAGCVLLALTLPWPSVMTGVVVLLVGIVYRALRIRAG